MSVTPRSGESSPVDLALDALGLAPAGGAAGSQFLLALIAASRTDLVASVPERTARGMAPSIGLQVFAFPVTVPSEAMRMAWHPRQSADPAHRWLRERMRQVLDEPRWIAPSVASLTTGAARVD